MFSVFFFIVFSFSYGSHSHFLVTSVYLHGNGATYLPDNVSVPAIIAFGDSLLDPGNNNRLMTMTKANFPPYGKDFVGGKPTGRFTNGKTLGDFLGTYSFACFLLSSCDYFNVHKRRIQDKCCVLQIMQNLMLT
ncbi:putative triacylglycerol lipase [Helianthus anomalus]